MLNYNFSTKSRSFRLPRLALAHKCASEMPTKREEERRKELEEQQTHLNHWSYTQKLPEGGGAEMLTKTVDFKRLTKGSKSRVVVLFAAKWCPPSRFFRRLFDEAADSSKTQLRVVDVDAPGTAAVAKRFGVVCTPVLLYLLGGEEKGRLEGISPTYSPKHPYTGPLQSSRVCEFSAAARGASRGTSRRRPLITAAVLENWTAPDAFPATAKAKVEQLLGGD